MQTIRQGEKTFLEVGAALKEIKARKLYREDFGTFALFMEATFGKSARYGYYLIESAEAAENVNNCSQNQGELLEVGGKAAPIPKVERESQARALAKVPPKSQPAVWKKAVKQAGGSPPTAKQVSQVADELARKSKPKKAKKPTPPPATFEAEIKELRFLARAVPLLLKDLKEEDYKDTFYAPAHVRARFGAIMDRIIRGLETAVHVALCPPSVEDVRAFAIDEDWPDYAEDYVNHYDGNGWEVGGSLMKNWRTKYRQWCKRQPEFKRNGKPEPGGHYVYPTAENTERLARAIFSDGPDAPAA